MTPEHERQFREFVATRSAGLLRTAYFLTGGDVHDAQDLLQTALMATARHWGRIVRRDQPEAYVRRALARHQINRWRARVRRPETLVPAPPDRATTDGEQAGVELRPGLMAALRALPPRQRATVVLRYYEDRSESEVAQLLSVSVGTVRSQAAKGLAKLRTAYEGPSEPPPAQAWTRSWTRASTAPSTRGSTDAPACAPTDAPACAPTDAPAQSAAAGAEPVTEGDWGR